MEVYEITRAGHGEREREESNAWCVERRLSLDRPCSRPSTIHQPLNHSSTHPLIHHALLRRKSFRDRKVANAATQMPKHAAAHRNATQEAAQLGMSPCEIALRVRNTIVAITMEPWRVVWGR